MFFGDELSPDQILDARLYFHSTLYSAFKMLPMFPGIAGIVFRERLAMHINSR